MAQLRDARTGEVIAEGPPHLVVYLADATELRAGVVGINGTANNLDLMYDDVGLAFDPDAVRKAADDNIEHTEGELAEALVADRDRAYGAKTQALAVRESAQRDDNTLAPVQL